MLVTLFKASNLAEVWGTRPDGTNPCRKVERFLGASPTLAAQSNSIAIYHSKLPLRAVCVDCSVVVWPVWERLRRLIRSHPHLPLPSIVGMTRGKRQPLSIFFETLALAPAMPKRCR